MCMDPNKTIIIGGDVNDLKYEDFLNQSSLTQLVKQPNVFIK